MSGVFWGSSLQPESRIAAQKPHLQFIPFFKPCFAKNKSSLVQTKEINYTKERYLPYASQLVSISTAIPSKNINAWDYTLQPPLGTLHVTHVRRNVLQN